MSTPTDSDDSRLLAQPARALVPDDQRWNHNIHHHDDLLAAIERGTGARIRRALDIGCGEGQLTRRLASVADLAVGLDPDAPSLDEARAQTSAGAVRYVRGSLLDPPFAARSFDAVTCVMTLHHVDLVAGLTRLAELVAPGGTLGVIGAGRTRLPHDLPYEMAGAVMTRIHRLRRGYWEHHSPTVWPPPTTCDEVRATAEQLLPGATFTRKVLWRYVLTWTKPA